MKTRILIAAITVFTLVASCGNKQNQDGQEKVYEQLFQAIGKDDAETFNLLVERLPNIDSLVMVDTNHTMYTPLGYTCKYDRCAFAEKFVKLKANINLGAEDEEDEIFAMDALSLAIKNGSECIVKLLLDHGANPNIIYDEYGNTPLMLSVEREQNNRISKMLIDKGANIDGAGDLGFGAKATYPLFNALYSGNIEMARYLIEKGCRLDIENDEGTPLGWAQKNGEQELEALIRKHLGDRSGHPIQKNASSPPEISLFCRISQITSRADLHEGRILPG